MNQKQEKQFETKFTTAVIGFAMQLQSIMENANEDIAEKVIEKYKENPEMSIEEITKYIAEGVTKELVKEFDLWVKNDEVKS